MGKANKKLALDLQKYFTIVFGNRTVHKRVAEAKIDISEYFRKNKTIKGIEKIPGVGQKTLAAIEMVLTHGVDKAIDIMVSEFNVKQSKKALESIPNHRKSNLDAMQKIWENFEACHDRSAD